MSESKRDRAVGNELKNAIDSIIEVEGLLPRRGQTSISVSADAAAIARSNLSIARAIIALATVVEHNGDKATEHLSRAGQEVIDAIYGRH